MSGISSECLEEMVQHLGFSGMEIEELDNLHDERHSENGSSRNLIQRFRNKGFRWIYEAVFTEYGLQCSCKEWQSRKCCRHIVYVFDRLSVRDEHGRITGISRVVNGKPHDREAIVRVFGKDSPEAEKWLSEHLEIIEL